MARCCQEEELSSAAPSLASVWGCSTATEVLHRARRRLWHCREHSAFLLRKKKKPKTTKKSHMKMWLEAETHQTLVTTKTLQCKILKFFLHCDFGLWWEFGLLWAFTAFNLYKSSSRALVRACRMLIVSEVTQKELPLQILSWDFLS